jgi:hypothetical protein
MEVHRLVGVEYQRLRRVEVKTIGATAEYRYYKSTMNLWLKHHLPRDTEKLQKKYLQKHIRKPEKLSIKVANLQLTAINFMLKSIRLLLTTLFL